MKLLIQLSSATRLLTIALLTCLWVAPVAHAVVPPPDGGYSNFTTAEGTNALKNLTAGSGNTGIGWVSLFSATLASFNTGVGAGTLALNNADQNTATGAGALLLNTSGTGNTANGAFALLHNDDGQGNTAVGTDALFDNTSGSFSTATGFGALVHNNTNANTANGALALQNNTTGFGNTGIGGQALQSNQSGSHNTATGFQALLFNTISDDNTAYGYQTLVNNTGQANTAVGFQALYHNTDSNFNTAIGWGALGDSTGGDNTAVGQTALNNNTTGSLNTALGAGAGISVTTGNNVICIGAAGANVDNSCYISNIWNQPSPSGTTVFVNSDGKLGVTLSSRRFKDKIEPMGKGSEAILALQPVTFRYKKELDPTKTAQFGLVAEDVEKVNPDLIVRDKEGKPYSVRYDQVNAMLLNEFLKEHRKVNAQQKQIDALTAQLKQQEARIQKISDQLEMTKPVARLAQRGQ
jgi:Chaperone of endosialidase